MRREERRRERRGISGFCCAFLPFARAMVPWFLALCSWFALMVYLSDFAVESAEAMLYDNAPCWPRGFELITDTCRRQQCPEGSTDDDQCVEADIVCTRIEFEMVLKVETASGSTWAIARTLPEGGHAEESFARDRAERMILEGERRCWYNPTHDESVRLDLHTIDVQPSLPPFLAIYVFAGAAAFFSMFTLACAYCPGCDREPCGIFSPCVGGCCDIMAAARPSPVDPTRRQIEIAMRLSREEAVATSYHNPMYNQ